MAQCLPGLGAGEDFLEGGIGWRGKEGSGRVGAHLCARKRDEHECGRELEGEVGKERPNWGASIQNLSEPRKGLWAGVPAGSERRACELAGAPVYLSCPWLEGEARPPDLARVPLSWGGFPRARIQG